MSKATTRIVLALVALVLAVIVAWLWLRPTAPPTSAPAATPELPPAVSASTSAAPVPYAPASAFQYPIEAPVAAADTAPSPADIESALADLFGRKSVLSLFQVDDFPRRVVATVDNLGRGQAHARLWPVNPTGGRFTVQRQGEAAVVSADNGLRYTPFVLLIETVDLRQVVALYTRLYPQFQRAYEVLGYPKRYFNDRLVQVIDLLLATPDPTTPLKVSLPVINGPVPPERPWVLYEFDDPALQSLAAGQKLLLRMGPVNERRMKARLAELRRLVTASAPSR